MSSQSKASDVRSGLCEDFARYVQAAGLDHSASPGDMEAANRAVMGELLFQGCWTRIGRQGIDWSARHHAHQEWPATLNRFMYLNALVLAWESTRDERYAETVCDQVRDWIRAHPERGDWAIAPTDNKLNLALRLCSWWNALPRLLDSPALDDALIEAAASSTICQLAFLETRLDGGNWRIAQADAFLTCGLILRRLPDAAAWRVFAAEILNDTFRRQVFPDGAHVECNPSYHEWMTSIFERCWRLGRAFPELGIAVTADVLARMHDYALACRRPNGERNGMHDCQGAETGARKPDWDKARREFRCLAGLPDVMPPTIQVFGNAGQAFLRDGWDERAVYITFDATTYGGSHCHMGRNAIQLHAYGRSLLVDPGTLSYERTDPLMAYGKSTRAHNTLNFNGWNQCYANPCPIRHLSAPGYECLSSYYQGGYWPGRYTWGFDQGNGTGFWGVHHRTLLWIRDRCLVVLDAAGRAPEAGGTGAWAHPVLESCWQFASGKVSLDALAGKAVSLYEDANALMLFPLQPAGAELKLHEGENDPPRGWASYKPAPQVCLSATIAPPDPRKCCHLDLATVIVPFAGREAPEVRASAVAPKGSQPGRVALVWPDGTRDEVLWRPLLETMVGKAYGVDSDGSLVHVRRDASGRVLQSFAFDSTFCRFGANME